MLATTVDEENWDFELYFTQLELPILKLTFHSRNTYNFQDV